MRKASDASFSALICPVSTTVSPAPLFSAVIVRTGRAWTALASVLRSQAASRAVAATRIRPSVAARDGTSAGNHGMRRALRRVYSSSDMDFCDFSRSSFSISSAALKPAIWRISSRAIRAWARLRSAMPPPWVRM